MFGRYFGNVQAVTDNRVSCRASTLAQDAPSVCEIDNVINGEEVILVVEFCDEFELVLDTFVYVTWDAVRPAFIRAF